MGNAGVLLAAMLKAAGEAAPAAMVRLACIRTLGGSGGGDWGDAVRWLRGTGRLVEDIDAGTWAPGPGLDDIDTDGWPDDRAKDVWAQIQAEKLC